jgi:aspartokinase
LAALLIDLRALGDVSCDTDRGVIALVGAGLADHPKVMAQALEALGGTRLDMLSLSATGLNLTVVVDAREFVSVTRRLHAAFFTGAQAEELLGERLRSNGPLEATV